MVTITVSMPEPIKAWVEAQTKDGTYNSASDYILELLCRDRESHAFPELTVEDVRRIVSESRESGISSKTFDDIHVEARAAARESAFVRE